MMNVLFQLRQADHFSQAYLKQLFENGAIKSQAVGIDGVRPSAFAKSLEDEIKIIERKVADQSYHFTPFKERLILRGPSRPPRQLAIPTVRDRLTLRATCNALTSVAPASVPAPPHAHIKKIVQLIRSGQQNLSFVRLDVQNFYPSLRHDILMKSILDNGAEPIVSNIVEKAVTTRTGFTSEAPNQGVPQGLSISNILSSIYMAEYDKGHGQDFCRYVDDIMFVVPSHEATAVLEREWNSLEKIGLKIHMPGVGEKTKIARIGEGIDYLGYRIFPQKVAVRPSSYKKMFDNILRVCTKYKYSGDVGRFIFRLNLKVTGCIIDGKRRGWLLFFSQTEDTSQLKNLDRFVTRQLNRLKVGNRQNEVKRFVRAYYELRFNGHDTKYIPNFDTYTAAEKIDVMSIITGKSKANFDGLSEDEVDSEFGRIIAKEVQDLEKDVIDAIS